MSAKKSFHGWLLPVLVACVAMWPTPNYAQTSGVDPDAVNLLRRSTDYLAGMKQFNFVSDTSIEAVLDTGQKLQFDHRVSVSVQRPNKMRAERTGELITQVLYYDGKSLTMDLPENGYHATVEAPATIEAMLDFARDKFNVIAPGADLIYNNSFHNLTDGLTSAMIVADSVVNGVLCDHIAFRNAEVDWQIWIQKGDKPLPRKFVVTSKRMAAAPEFIAVISEWNPAPKLNDATFRYVPAKDSRAIEFIPVAAAATK